MDVTKDSKYMLAAAVTSGVKIYDVKTGDMVAHLPVPGPYCK